MNRFLALLSALALVVVATTPMPAGAHSPKELERLMGDKEKFFQPIDTPAPAFELRDADGRTVGLADLRGRAVVLHFIYASCPDVCPLHAEKIAEVQKMVNDTPMKAQVEFVTITTDPVKDTPDVMRKYGPAHGLDPANWTFLTTTPDQAEDASRRLAAEFGHKFAKVNESYQAHGVVTHIIDREGRWRANFHGLRFEPTNLVLFLNGLVNESGARHEHGESSWWDRLKGLF